MGKRTKVLYWVCVVTSLALGCDSASSPSGESRAAASDDGMANATRPTDQLFGTFAVRSALPEVDNITQIRINRNGTMRLTRGISDARTTQDFVLRITAETTVSGKFDLGPLAVPVVAFAWSYDSKGKTLSIALKPPLGPGKTVKFAPFKDDMPWTGAARGEPCGIARYVRKTGNAEVDASLAADLSVKLLSCGEALICTGPAPADGAKITPAPDDFPTFGDLRGSPDDYDTSGVKTCISAAR
jgi:hypothetical protein